MSSIYKKGNYYYLSWYDPIQKKTMNRSTRIEASTRGERKAKKFKKEFDKKLAELSEEGSANSSFHGSKISDSIKHFYIVNQNKKANTIAGYDMFFKRFVDGKHFSPNDPTTKVTKEKAEAWLLALGQNNNYAQNTLFNYTKILKKYLKFLASYGYISHPIILNDDVTYKPQTKPVISFDDKEIALMLKKIKTKPKNIQIAFYLLFYTGLRPTDIFNIKLRDIDFENREIKIYSQKTDEYSLIAIQKKLVEELLPLVSNFSPEEKILKYSNVKNMNRSIHRFLTEIGIKRKGINLRTFRKTFITKSYLAGIDYPTVAKLVGHKKITTTQKYYTYFDTRKQKEELEKLNMGGE